LAVRRSAEKAPEADRGPSVGSRRELLSGLCAFSALAAVSPVRLLADVRQERVLSLVSTHTSERLSVPYFGDGGYLTEGLGRLNRLLRDHRTGDEHPIDPRLFDLLHDLRLATGTRTPFQVISGYRSAATNAHLRQGSGGVASRSLHMDGRAIDVRLGDVSSAALRDAALELRRGGVGYYPSSDFVHVDTGRVRAW
jgi:uncharacterized protein YcbK (DUF882 family)